MEGNRSLFFWHWLGTLLCASILLWLPGTAQSAAGPARVGVVIAGDAYYFSLTYQEMTRQVQARVPDTEFLLLTPASLRATGDGTELDLLVTFGNEATHAALEHAMSTPLLATFITEATFQHYIDNSGARQSQRKISAIYLDQPPAHRIRLARALVPRGRTLGTALGPVANRGREQLATTARDSGFEPVTTAITLTSNPDRELSPIFRQADVFVVIPDSPQLNQAASRWILNLGYRTRTPVVGFSHSYTQAGALASLYTAPEDIGRHTGESIAAWLCCGSDELWTPRHARYFTIDTNTSVARALGIELPPGAELYRAVLDHPVAP